MTGFLDNWRRLRVVLVHDWLTGLRGGERVLELLCAGFPQAPIYTLVHDPGTVGDTIGRRDIRTSWLDRVPGARRHYRMFLPLFPAAAASMRLPPCDLVISLSHCAAKSARAPAGARHLCYCFTPMRYAWLFGDEYFGRNPLKRAALAPLLAWLRRWDRRTAARVTEFATLSLHVRQRIRDFYGRDARVVYPPVNTGFWTPAPDRAAAPAAHDLVVSALVPYKRIDLAIAAYNRLGAPLRIAGDGPELRRLRAMAGPNVSFLGRLNDEALRAEYRACRALVFPGQEDFGLVPVEAQACGKPVIAFGRGGAAETVRHGETGILFAEQTVESLADAAKSAWAAQWNPAACRANAERFGIERFVTGFAECIQACMAERSTTPGRAGHTTTRDAAPARPA